MFRMTVLTAALVVLAMTGMGQAQEQAPGDWFAEWVQADTMTCNWFGVGEQLEENGVYLNLSLTQVYQTNLRSDNTQVHRHAGRYTGTYNLELELDLQQMLDVPGMIVFTAAEGSWSDGLDASSIGSVFGVNNTAGGDRSIDVTQLYYQLNLLDDTLRFRLGKVDLTGGFECRGCPVAFDTNSYANDDSFQFLNGSLNNNPTIPFPENGIGAVVYWQPLEWWYFAGGVGDQQADERETGFNTAFHDEDRFFGIFETGVAPKIDLFSPAMQGAYRVGFWTAPGETFDGKTKSDDTGFYVSFDQKLLNENDQDDQGLAIFGRYGYAHKETSDITNFYSIGAQYQGLVPTRDNDILGFGFSYGKLSRDAGFARSNEKIYELYYNMELTNWLRVTPDLQVVQNAGGADASAVVMGVRAQLDF